MLNVEKSNESDKIEQHHFANDFQSESVNLNIPNESDTQNLCKEVLSFLKEMSNINKSHEADDFVRDYFGNGFELEKINSTIPQECRETQRYVNLLSEYSIIYIITAHKYLNEIWGDKILQSDAIINYREHKKKFFNKCLIEEISQNLAREVNRKTEFIEQGLRGILAKKLLDASTVKNMNIVELLTDSVMLKNKCAVSNKKPKDWESIFEKIEQDIKKSPHMSHSKECSQVFLHSVTYRGNNHNKCDDTSDVTLLDEDDENSFFAYVSDGVGSAQFSNNGSSILGASFTQIAKNVHNNEAINNKNILDYIFNKFPLELYNEWENRVRKFHKTMKRPELDISNYAATFLFAWKDKGYFFTGILGDGNYFLEKCNNMDKSRCGYFELTDGFSGVIQKNVCSIVNLKADPKALRISVFDEKEISAIMMTSDGAAAIKCKKIDDAIIMDLSDYLHAKDYFTELNSMGFKEQKEYLHEMAMQFSLANMGAGGRGDDCSIVYIQMKN